MAILKFQTGPLTVLRGSLDMVRSPQTSPNRIRAISAHPGEDVLNAAPHGVVRPAPIRRPGLAARWKGQHRLAISY
jgi:hypothetical protein